MENLKIDDRLFYERPFNCEKLRYNYDENRYILTLEGSRESAIDLTKIWRGAANAEKYLDLVSRALYGFIFSNKDSKYQDKFKWLMAHSKSFRANIIQAFQDVIWYNHRDGGFLVAYNTGINLNTMDTVDLEIKRAVSVVGEALMRSSGMLERIPRYSISRKRFFLDIEELKEFLVKNKIFKEEELEDIESIDKIPKSMKYRIYANPYNDIVYEDLTFWQEEKLLKGSDW